MKDMFLFVRNQANNERRWWGRPNDYFITKNLFLLLGMLDYKVDAGPKKAKILI